MNERDRRWIGDLAIVLAWVIAVLIAGPKVAGTIAYFWFDWFAY